MNMHNLFPNQQPLPLSWSALATLIAAATGTIPVLAGGALRDHLHGKPVKDLDFFVPFSVEGVQAVRRLFGDEMGLAKVQEVGASCEGLNEVNAVLGFAAPATNPDHPEVNIIFLDPEAEFSVEAVAERCDFGICQIGARQASFGSTVWIMDYTLAFATDVSERTFTLTREGDEERSFRRYERLQAKYPEHRLIVA